jgi:hypothetical protein
MKLFSKNSFCLKLFTVLLLCLQISCKKTDQPTGPSTPDATSFLSAHRSAKQPIQEGLLVDGLAGSLGSTVGPGGDLFVPDPVAGEILRIDPKTGEVSVFASGLPKMIPEVGLGGITDVVFVGGRAYALVTMVDDPVLFPTGEVNGIYRIDGPNSFTIIADIGAFNLAHRPSGFFIEVGTGVSYSIQTYRGGFLVSDGHLNRVLEVTPEGEISIVQQFGNVVPTGMDVKGNRVYLSQAGPLPHRPENGKVVLLSGNSSGATTIASGAPLLVDVEFGRGQTVFALSQGDFSGNPEGSPALPNTGSLVQVNANGTLTVIADELNIPTSLEIIGNTAYIITLTGEIWVIDNIAGPPFGRAHHKRQLKRRG